MQSINKFQSYNLQFYRIIGDTSVQTNDGKCSIACVECDMCKETTMFITTICGISDTN